MIASEVQDEPIMSWSTKLKAGDEFTWKIETYKIPEIDAAQATTYTTSNFKNETYYPSESTYYTTAYTEVTTVYATETYDVEYYEPVFEEGTKMKVKILKPPSELDTSSFYEYEYDEDDILDDYFEISLDGNSSYEYFIIPLTILIFPVIMTLEDGSEVNFFEATVDGTTSELFGEEEENVDRTVDINNNIFTIHDIDSGEDYEFDAKAKWAVDTGILHLYHVKEQGGLEMKIVLDTGSGLSIDLPVPMFWILYALIALPILRKRIKS
jgi:hypothetical protein